MEEILADSDEEIDGSDNEQSSKPSKRKKKKTWIQDNEDNIVDFIDPTSAKNISSKIIILYIFRFFQNFYLTNLFIFILTATKPVNSNETASNKSKVKDYGFKTAPDGRLIIKDDSDDSDDERKKKKKNKLSFLNSDSENDDGKFFLHFNFIIVY